MGLVLAASLVLFFTYTEAFIDVRAPVQPVQSEAITEDSQPQQQVHLIFSSHLDVGFDIQGRGGWDNTVIDIYFHQHFPTAIAVADAFRANGTDRFRYMTQTFLVSLFLDCPPYLGIRCPNDTEVESFKAAVARGDIYWHALPHNAQSELYDVSLLEAAVGLTHEIDAALGLPPKITMSQRDVPGITRSVVPVLAGMGIKALTMGVNGGSAPPAIPHNTPFRWRDERSGSELLVMQHPGGYSGNPVDNGPNECVTVHGFNHVLCASWHLGDNSGPHPFSCVSGVDNGDPSDCAPLIFQRVREAFPDANVFASTFDDYTHALVAAAPDLDLPIVTQEIGDTWIYGVQSDSDKVAEYRAFLRMRRTMPQHFDSYEMRNFSRFLIKVPEHTWGVDVKTYLPDTANWANWQFQDELASNAEDYTYIQGAWTRQRSYTRWALQALGNSAMGLQFWGVLSELEQLKKVPDVTADGWKQLAPGDSLSFGSHAWNVSLDPTSGAMVSLQRRWPAANRVGAQWANASRPLGRFLYSTYTEADYDVIWDEYLYIDRTVWWITKDLGKSNCSSAGPVRSDTPAAAQGFWVKQDSEDSFEVLVVAALPSNLTEHYGAPAQIWFYISSPAASDRLLYDVLWVNKTATRLPEALWAEFAPDATVADPDSWLMSKLGSPVSPTDIVVNGSHSMHGVDDDGISVQGYGSRYNWEQLSIRTLDTALVSPGSPNPFPNVKHAPDMTQGMTFCLGNNIWGTNYVMWQPYLPEAANQRFRFELQMSDLEEVSTRQQAMAVQ